MKVNGEGSRAKTVSDIGAAPQQAAKGRFPNCQELFICMDHGNYRRNFAARVIMLAPRKRKLRISDGQI